jgi:hypothetical protein
MTYIGWPPHIALEENVGALSANYAFRKKVRVLRNAPRELANVVTPNATARIKAKNREEGSLLSIIKIHSTSIHIKTSRLYE